MAIQQPTQVLSTTLLPELSSRVVLLTRTEIDNGNGSCSVKFGATVHPVLTTFEVDVDSKPTAIYETKNFDAFDMSDEQFDILFGLRVTLADGTVSTMGEVISNLTDQFIAQNVNILGVITTKHIDIQAVIAAQMAQDAAANTPAPVVPAPTEPTTPSPDPSTPNT